MALQASSPVLEQMDLPEKLYIKKEKEMPKVLGGLKIGLRELVVITGASSGLGLNCAVTLARTGKYFVVMAVRDVEKAKRGKFDVDEKVNTYVFRRASSSDHPRLYAV